MQTSVNAQRPTSVTAMVAALKLLGTEEGFERGLTFQPGNTDVIISPFPKSCTTWLQQMVHALRTRGRMDFREVSEVVPWLEMAHDLGQDIIGPQQGTPRAFKSHLNWDQVPKGAKYIYAIRNPKDVVVSWYHFFEGWFFEPGAFSLREFTKDFFLEIEPQHRYWFHIASWWQQRHNPDVLLL